MNKRALAAIVLSAALWFSFAAVGEGQDAGLRSDWQPFTLTSRLVPSPAEVGVLLPPGYDAKGAPLPLLLYLHGGGGSAQALLGMRTLLENAWADGSLQKLVVVTPSAGRSLYADYRDGSQRWETFILEEVLTAVRSRFKVRQDGAGTVAAGGSMGGLGALRMAFKHPDRFRAIAVWAPGVEPAMTFSAIEPSDRAHRAPELYEEIFGKPVDEDYWQRNHPPHLLRTRLKEIAASGLEISISVGREDQFHLYRGAEVIHRLLDDAGIKHDYRVVRHANHNGGRYLLDGLKFLDTVLRAAPRQP